MNSKPILPQMVPPPVPAKLARTEVCMSSRDTDDMSFLRLAEVKAITGLSKSSIYALIRAHSFPAPIQLGPRTVAWVRSEIRDWATERFLTSRSAASRPGSKRMPQPALREAWSSSKKWA